MITEVMIRTSPAYVGTNHVDVYLPGQLDVRQLFLKKPICLYASPLNPGAEAAAAELATGLSGLTFTSKPPIGGDAPMLQLPPRVEEQESLGSPRSPRGSKSSRSPGEAPFPQEPTHFLLYLSAETFVGDVGRRFGAQVALMRQNGIPYLMIHENDPKKHGCEFGHFFKTTPQRLIDDGLYGPLAIAFFPGAHRQISLRLAAKALGARTKTASEAAAKSIVKACRASKLGLRRIKSRCSIMKKSRSASDDIGDLARADPKERARPATYWPTTRLSAALCSGLGSSLPLALGASTSSQGSTSAFAIHVVTASADANTAAAALDQAADADAAAEADEAAHADEAADADESADADAEADVSTFDVTIERSWTFD
jgi:hypothetical protein